jgi:hypothetical protein
MFVSVKNAFSLSPKASKVLTVPTLFKSPNLKFLLGFKAKPSVIPCKNQEKLPASKI